MKKLLNNKVFKNRLGFNGLIIIYIFSNNILVRRLKY